MTTRKPGETIADYAIRTVWQYGHFWNPANPNGLNITQKDLSKLKVTDQVVIDAFRSFSRSDATLYAQHVLQTHGRRPQFDGILGPALQAMIDDPAGRCPIPDFAPPVGAQFAFEDASIQEVVVDMQRRVALPAIGVGNWKGCHNIGQFHCASCMVNPANMPTFLKPLFKQILGRVQAAYAATGLLWRFVDQNRMDLLTGQQFDGNINTDMSFVTSSSGWIGLAILGGGETCSGRIWNRYLATYRGGSTDDQIVMQWTTLIKHELGHNCGKDHTNGGVMNPSIVNGLPAEFGENDPTTPWLRKQFGGVPVPIGGGSPQPGPTPPPPMPTEARIRALEQRVDALHVENLVQQILIDRLLKPGGVK